MQATGKKSAGTLYEVTIKESVSEMEKYKKEAIRVISDERQFDGFRKWDEVPFEVIAREIGEDKVMQEALNQALQILYPKALKKLEINPVDMGEIKEVKSITPLEVTLTVEIAPEVELDIKKIEKISIVLPQVSVSDEELKSELDEIVTRNTHYHIRGEAHGHEHDENGAVESTDETIQDGDKVTVNAIGYDKKWGVTDDRMKLTDFEVTIGSKTMIPGFEEALIGSKKGDVVEFEVTFPKEYHSEDFAGKNAFFVVTILSAQFPHTPEWDEAFIERIWGKKLSLSDFKVEYREAMLIDRKEKARSESEEKLTEELIMIMPLEVGEKMVLREVENLWLYHNREIEKQGMDIKSYLEHLKTTEDIFKKEHLEPVAKKRVQSMLIMEALKKHYAPEITDDTVVTEIRKVFTRYAHNADFEARILELSKPGTEHFNDVKSRLEYRAVIDRFLK